MAFPNVEVSALAGAACATEIDATAVPEFEMRLHSSGLIERSGERGRSGSAGDILEEARRISRYLASRVLEAAEVADHAELALSSFGALAVNLDEPGHIMTNRDVIKIKSRCVKVAKNYQSVADFVKQVRDWYMCQNMAEETPPQMPRVFRSSAEEGPIVVDGRGASHAFDDAHLSEYVRTMPLSKPLTDEEIAGIVTDVKKAIVDKVGSTVSSRYVMYFALNKIADTGASVLAPAGIEKLTPEELRAIGRRVHLYQMSHEMFWRIHDLMFD